MRQRPLRLLHQRPSQCIFNRRFNWQILIQNYEKIRTSGYVGMVCHVIIVTFVLMELLQCTAVAHSKGKDFLLKLWGIFQQLPQKRELFKLTALCSSHCANLIWETTESRASVNNKLNMQWFCHFREVGLKPTSCWLRQELFTLWYPV